MSDTPKEFPKATPRPWLREIHDARGDEARIVIVSRDPKFTCGYYVVCADEMQIRREQAIADYEFIITAVNSYDSMREELASLREQVERLRDAATEAEKFVAWCVEDEVPNPPPADVILNQLRAALKDED